MYREPMKIEYLLLENFIYLQSGLKKTKIELDLSKSKHPINVFIGGIGSCKTFILSHLQPFATMGSLDIRNQDDQIIEGKDGLKIIKYKVNDTQYEIRHEYIWVERSETHTTKSYIYKDGEDLNPTGNVSSFKYVIVTEFGLEQSFLRLIRIGANVTGLLELSTTERKSFVASMLDSANAMLALNKKLKDELRNCTTSISVISNKLAQLEASKLEEYEERLNDINIEIVKIESEIKEREASISKHNAEIALVAPEGFEYLQYMINEYINDIEAMRIVREEIETKLKTLADEKDIPTLAKQIGACEADIENMKVARMKASSDHDDYVMQINALNTKIAIIQNDTHLKELQRQYEIVKGESQCLWNEINGFECPYTDTQLKNFINELHEIDVMISDITQYSIESIRKVYHSDASIIKWANEKGEILTGRKINLGKRMANLAYSAKYVKETVMYTPPFCPTSNCPYKRTHPYTLSLGKNELDINEEVKQLQDQINDIDRELYIYAEYPVIYNKISSLRNRFESATKVLKDIGCLVEGSLLIILTRLDKQTWYDYDAIIDTQEKCIKKSQYYEILERLRIIDDELRQYNSNDIENLTSKVEEIEKLRSQCFNIIEEADSRIRESKTYLEELYIRYRNMMDKALDEKKLQDIIHEIDLKAKELETMAKNADKIAPYELVNREHQIKINMLLAQRNEILDEKNKLSVKIAEIKHGLADIEEIMVDQKYLSYMVSATSSKEGIPLELVNDFVKGCKDIVNELTFDIFEDDIQLEEFQIDEKEFYVPYSIDGKYIKDVTKASQGQRSLFSIAIAFAFSQNLQIPYNIPLCDEPDAPLHKTEHMKFLSLLLRHMKANNSIQLFLITHNSALENIPVNFIATTPEDVNLSNGSTLITLYD